MAHPNNIRSAESARSEGVLTDTGCRINRKASNTSMPANQPKVVGGRSNHEEEGAHREDR